MKLPYFSRRPAPHADFISATIERALAGAGLQTRASTLLDVNETIRQALASVGQGGLTRPLPDDDAVIDVTARVVAAKTGSGTAGARAQIVEGPAPPGQFVRRSFSNHAGSRSYKIYVPTPQLASPVASMPMPMPMPMPMLVMLHGCTQSADDFAAGTQMNRLAQEHGFIVIYPEQPPSANPSKCWNWFKTQDQCHARGEPSLIAGITRAVRGMQAVDPDRIFVAGLSAGGAMAVIMAETYPRLYAGAGVHSGLPFASAHDIPSAMSAMKGRPQVAQGLEHRGSGAAGASRLAHAVPTIVFHGDRDTTVKQSNAKAIVLQACTAHARSLHQDALMSRTDAGTSRGGRAYSRTVHTHHATGEALVESWVLHGAGHAWSGGDASGSFTDGAGPDASAEMLRFFLALPRGGFA